MPRSATKRPLVRRLHHIQAPASTPPPAPPPPHPNKERAPAPRRANRRSPPPPRRPPPTRKLLPHAPPPASRRCASVRDRQSRSPPLTSRASHQPQRSPRTLLISDVPRPRARCARSRRALMASFAIDARAARRLDHNVRPQRQRPRAAASSAPRPIAAGAASRSSTRPTSDLASSSCQHRQFHRGLNCPAVNSRRVSERALPLRMAPRWSAERIHTSLAAATTCTHFCDGETCSRCARPSASIDRRGATASPLIGRHPYRFMPLESTRAHRPSLYGKVEIYS
jgi:hypothetical protein